MTQTSGATLFEAEPSSATVRPLFLTNRFNLLEILSAGYIAPRASYSKYYKDLLESCPGRIPLIRGPVPQEIQDAVRDGSDASFPVALEIDSSSLSIEAVPALREDGKTVRAPLTEARCLVWAPAGVIPLTAVNRVIFQTQKHLEEHTAREYANVNSDAVPLGVEPDLFRGQSSSAKWLDWLRGLPDAGGQDSETFGAADRAAGARCLAIVALPFAPMAEQVVRGLLEIPDRDPGVTGASAPSGVASWITLEAIAGTGGRPVGADLNGRLFAACAEVMRGVDRSAAWRPLEVLEAIEKRARARKLSKRDEGELTRNLEPIRAILKNERDFKPFRPTAGLDVAKALLLVLQRPDPKRLLDWSPSETGARDAVIVTAAVLVGLLSGRTRLPVSLRPLGLDRLLAALASADLSRHKDGLRLVNGINLAIKIARTESNTTTDERSLTWDDLVLQTWRAPPKATATGLGELDLKDPVNRETALEVCRMSGWAQAVYAQIVLDEADFHVRRKGGGVIIRASGWPVIAQELDETAFREKLGTQPLSDEVETYFRARMSQPRDVASKTSDSAIDTPKSRDVAFPER